MCYKLFFHGCFDKLTCCPCCFCKTLLNHFFWETYLTYYIVLLCLINVFVCLTFWRNLTGQRVWGRGGGGRLGGTEDLCGCVTWLLTSLTKRPRFVGMCESVCVCVEWCGRNDRNVEVLKDFVAHVFAPFWWSPSSVDTLPSSPNNYSSGRNNIVFDTILQAGHFVSFRQADPIVLY